MIDKNAFVTDGQHNEIQLLDLSSNFFSEINGKFDKLLQLKALQLSHNKIESIKEDTFKENKKLNFLNLQFNKLINFNCDLKYNNELSFLNLKNNFIQLLAENTMQPYLSNPPSKRILLLNFNRLQCNCSMIWILKHDTPFTDIDISSYCIMNINSNKQRKHIRLPLFIFLNVFGRSQYNNYGITDSQIIKVHGFLNKCKSLLFSNLNYLYNLVKFIYIYIYIQYATLCSHD